MEKLKINRIKIWMICAVCAITVSSCVYGNPDEDWERNGRVRLHLDWRSHDSYPADMAYYFYKDGALRPVVRLGSASGYEGSLLSGEYKVVVCNTDFDNIVLDMDKGYEQACGKVRQISALKSSSVHVARPDNFYGTGSLSIDVKGEETVVEELYPVNLVKTLELNIKISGSDTLRIDALSGHLTGVSSEIHIPTGENRFDRPAFILFEPEATHKGGYASLLNIFGLSDGDSDGRVELHLNLAIKGGKKVTAFTDITEGVNKAFSQSISAHVILDLLVSYDEVNGMDISLEGWKEGSGEVGNWED